MPPLATAAAEPYGGFGLEYAQAAPAGSVILDRFGMAHVLPYVTPEPTVVTVRPASPRTRGGSRRAAARLRYSLPTGSLYWPDASGVILYSPAMRYRAYGGGYGLGAYGSADHSDMYQGRLLQY
jgi:hypothetical protein